MKTLLFLSLISSFASSASAEVPGFQRFRESAYLFRNDSTTERTSTELVSVEQSAEGTSVFVRRTLLHPQPGQAASENIEYIYKAKCQLSLSGNSLQKLYCKKDSRRADGPLREVWLSREFDGTFTAQMRSVSAESRQVRTDSAGHLKAFHPRLEQGEVPVLPFQTVGYSCGDWQAESAPYLVRFVAFHIFPKNPSGADLFAKSGQVWKTLDLQRKEYGRPIAEPVAGSGTPLFVFDASDAPYRISLTNTDGAGVQHALVEQRTESGLTEVARLPCRYHGT